MLLLLPILTFTFHFPLINSDHLSAKLQFMVWAPWALGSGLWALGSWALGSLGSGLWARRPGLQSLLGSRDYWAPWAPKQESALSL